MEECFEMGRVSREMPSSVLLQKESESTKESLKDIWMREWSGATLRVIMSSFMELL